MTYEYRCPSCGATFDVVKSYHHMQDPENCVVCHTPSVRAFAPSRLYLNGTSVQHAEYNPGLGCIVRNKEHRAELCKQKGVEEIGNEKPDSTHKHFEKQRADAWEKSWSDVDKGWVGDGT